MGSPKSKTTSRVLKAIGVVVVVTAAVVMTDKAKSNNPTVSRVDETAGQITAYNSSLAPSDPANLSAEVTVTQASPSGQEELFVIDRASGRRIRPLPTSDYYNKLCTPDLSASGASPDVVVCPTHGPGWMETTEFFMLRGLPKGEAVLVVDPAHPPAREQLG